jgi:uncharacterized membrane protein YbhN (UPF0104 family)
VKIDKKYAKLRVTFLGCLITAVIFIVISKNVNINKLPNILLNINLHTFFTAILIAFLTNFGVSAIKLKGILTKLGLPLNIREILFIKLGSIPLVATFPLRTGDLSKVAYLNKVFAFPANQGIASVILDLGGNLIALSFMLLFGTLLYPLHFTEQKSSIITIIALFMFMLPFFIYSRNNIRTDNREEAKKALSGKVKKALHDFLSNFRKIGPMNAFFIVGLSSIQMFGELLVFFLISKSLGLLIPFKSMLFFFPLINIISRLPVGFLGVGPREATVIIFFLAFAEKVQLLSLGMLYSLVEYVFPAMLGLIFLPFFVKKFSDSF